MRPSFLQSTAFSMSFPQTTWRSTIAERTAAPRSHINTCKLCHWNRVYTGTYFRLVSSQNQVGVHAGLREWLDYR